MAVLYKHFWLMFILVTCVNAGIWWHRGRKHREADPSLDPGYRRLVRGFVILGNVPWVIMGLGILSGRVPSVFGYFDLRDGGIYVSAFFSSLIVTWAAGTWWMFAGNGAEDLVRHPGLSNVPLTDPKLIKGMWLIGVISGVVGLIALFVIAPEIPVP